MNPIGSVPVYYDAQTGALSIDDEDVSGLVGGTRRQDRISRRINRLEGRAERLSSRQQQDTDVAPADVYQAAAARGMVTENQFNGLGSVNLVQGGTASLTDTCNRNMWIKSMVLDCTVPQDVLVTGISVAGLPINVGSKGAPISMFAKDSTRFGISFGRRLALTGQTVKVDFLHADAAGAADIVLGGLIVDELNPYAMQRWMEQMLLQAAVHGFEGPGF
ncbi:MAG: hypothetical protein NTW26_00345 [bacterium]|nr:hypothetical protein [bacterium]